MAGKNTPPKKPPNGKAPGNAEDSQQRVTRPELPRTEPIRSWSTLFGANSGPARAQSAYTTGTRTASDAVQRGVELGYRVVDEYLRQGTQAADAFSGRSRQQSMPSADFPQMAERMMRSAQDFSSLWFDMMGTLMQNMPNQASSGARPAPTGVGWSPSPGSAVAHSAGADKEHSETGRWRVIVRVESSRPTEATVTLDDTFSAAVVEPLRPAAGSAVIEASLEVATDPARVIRLIARVPPEVPADRYTGAVFDAVTGRPLGRVTIEVIG
jgi:hypothetical protein